MTEKRGELDLAREQAALALSRLKAEIVRRLARYQREGTRTQTLFTRLQRFSGGTAWVDIETALGELRSEGAIVCVAGLWYLKARSFRIVPSWGQDASTEDRARKPG